MSICALLSSTTTPSATRSFPAPTAQATIGPSQNIKCPTNNLTLYTSQLDEKKRFVLLCGRDYNSDHGAIDMYNQDAETMGDCIDMCASAKDCVGAGWGNMDGRDVCWIKSQLGQPGWSYLWYFAVLDNDAVVSTAPQR